MSVSSAWAWFRVKPGAIPYDLRETRFAISPFVGQCFGRAGCKPPLLQTIETLTARCTRPAAFAVEDKLFADRCPIGRESALPQIVADDGSRRRTRLVRVGPKNATTRGNDSQNGKEFCRDLAAFHVRRIAWSADGTGT